MTLNNVTWNGTVLSQGPISAMLDSGGNSIKVPPAAFKQIVKLLDLVPGQGTDGAKYYINCSSIGFAWNLPFTFVIGGVNYYVYFPFIFEGGECSLPGPLNNLASFHVTENTENPDQWYVE